MNLLLQILKGGVSNVPTPSSINYMWNMGSLAGVCLVVQILSGLTLSFHFSPSLENAFESVSLLEEVNLGWLLRVIHSNGASFFFIIVYVHVARGLFYGSYKLAPPWIVGVTLLLLLIGEAFLGYVLPWGQMSFWGATVITNLLSALPYGESLVEWVWGGYSVGGPTLSRFFSLHFLLPFLIVALSGLHLFLLHQSGSSNPLGLSLHVDNVFFHPLFSWKDGVGVGLLTFAFGTSVLLFPDMFSDPENFSPANPLSTPVHIQPEWYFLFAYAILRSVPNKLGGVLALIGSVSILLLLPLLSSGNSCRFSLFNTLIFWSFCATFVMLTFLGGIPAEGVYVTLSRVAGATYFLLLLLL